MFQKLHRSKPSILYILRVKMYKKMCKKLFHIILKNSPYHKIADKNIKKKKNSIIAIGELNKSMMKKI